MAAGLLIFLTPAIFAAPQWEPELFVDTDVFLDAAVSTAAVRDAIRARFVEIDFQILGGEGQPAMPPVESFRELKLNLFEDVSPTAVLDRVEVNSIGGYSWIGRIKGGGTVTLVVKEGVLSGSVRFSGMDYQIRYADEGVHVITQIDVASHPPEAEPIHPLELDRTSARGDLAEPLADDGTVFDILVVYTPAARASAGGSTAAIETRIQLGITETNQAYTDSGVTPRLRLVHTEEVSYAESGDIFTDLARLRGSSDGYIDHVHPLRDTYGADLVSMIAVNFSYCGVAYLMSGNNPGFESWAFSVIVEHCISPNYSFGHELGHNLGCNHAPDDPVGSGAYANSYAYKDPSRIFRTIMAHNCTSGSCPRVLQFSNPDVTYGGRVTGTATQNNALSINNVRSTIANFRQSAVSSTTQALDKSSLVFNGTTDRQRVTGFQTVRINVNGPATVHWTASVDRPWLSVSPSVGTDRGSILVTCDRASMPLTSWTGTVTVSSADVSNSPQIVSVSGTAFGPTSTSAPFGYFDTPVNGATGITGAIPVTGWALDDIEIDRVEIWRDPVAGEGSYLIYIGDAVFVEGARPDVEQAFPGYPFNYKGGWGYMLLTNFLPDQGNGTYTLHAYAYDQEGKITLLGSRTFTADNANGVLPFGTIDTPTQGGTASGTYRNWGWVLTPQPNMIPLNGSTLDVFVDGVPLGKVNYGYPRLDIQTLFPGYQNTDTATGYFDLDTTAYDDGVHTIAWRAEDDAGNADGIGSRYFVVENPGSN